MQTSEIVSKKVFVKYKSILKKILINVTKFGSSKEKDDVAYIYNYIDNDNDIHPIVFINYDENPWGNEFSPVKVFFTGSDFPSDINIFKTGSNPDYKVTLSGKINISDFKKNIIEKIKELKIIKENDEYKLDYNVISFGKVYVDILVNKHKDINELSKVNISKFNIIDNDTELLNIHSRLMDETQITINHDNKPIQMFYSIFPIKMDKLEYARIMKVHDNEVTSTVYCKEYIGNIIIHNFYKYIDFWNLTGKVGNK